VGLAERDNAKKRLTIGQRRFDECVEMLRAMFVEMTREGFDGRVQIDISAKDGYCGRPKRTVESWGQQSVATD
jgi:hypothetical protein